jgi:hypothetical protein
MKAKSIIFDRQEKMFILYGETGEYEDYRFWVVGIFKKEEKAKKYQIVLEEDATRHGIDIDCSVSFHPPCPVSLMDSGLITNWMGFGVEYSVGTMEVLDDKV